MSFKKFTPNNYLSNYINLYKNKSVSSCSLEPIKGNRVLCGNKNNCVILTTSTFFDFLMYVQDLKFERVEASKDINPIEESEIKSTYLKALGFRKGDIAKISREGVGNLFILVS